MQEISATEIKGQVIAIDGPVASGKGTIAPLLAARLQGFYLPTGVMYRCVALYAMQHELLASEEGIINALSQLRIRIRDQRVFLNEVDVTEAIKENAVSRNTARISAIPEVRKALIAEQREIGNEYLKQGMHVVAEGRDIATVVYPEAAVKLYLTASPAVRARRRLEQLHAQGDTQATYTSVFQDTVERDTYDQEKSKSLVTDPEKEGYTIIDNSERSQEDTLAMILRALKKQGIHYD